MNIFGADVSADELLKVLPGILAVIGAAVRLVPNLVTSARGHSSHSQSSDSFFRVVDYQAPQPFSTTFARRYVDYFDDVETLKARDAMGHNTLLLCGAGSVAAVVLTVAYLAYGLHRLPDWSLVLAVVVGVVAAGLLLRTYASVRQDPTRKSAAVTQTGSVVVRGREDDVRQHCLAALLDLGARLVCIDGPRILAATGISFGGDRWLGEVIWVTISTGPCDVVTVAIASTKTDFVSRSRSRRNVRTFMESWVGFPGDAHSQDRHTVAEKALSN